MPHGRFRPEVLEDGMTTTTMRAIAIACMVTTLLLVASASFAGTTTDLRRIVVFHDGVSEPLQRQVVTQSGSRLLRLLSLINSASIELPAVGTDSALAYLQSHYAVAAVYDDPMLGAHGEVAAIAQGGGGDGGGGDGGGGDQTIFVTPVAAPLIETYPWGIKQIGAADVQAGPHPLAGDGVKIAIFDTGVDRTHPDLAANLVGGFNAIVGADPSNYGDDNGHGTAMAGVIAARLNRNGVIGAAPRANLYAVKVLGSNGRGLTSDVIHALGVISARQDIRLINMSFGTSINWPLFPLAIQRTLASGKIIVASRGNASVDCTDVVTHGGGGDGGGGDGGGGDGGGGDTGTLTDICLHVRYPAAYPGVISVGATTVDDRIAPYSLSGMTLDFFQQLLGDPTQHAILCPLPSLECWRPKVDVVAPGGTYSATEPTEKMILTTNIGGGYGVLTGTSPAAAHVSGAVALALQLRPQLSAAEALDLLQRTAKHLQCPTISSTCPVERQGAGLIDVEAMVEALTK
jgi:subtilisin family serine protease